MRSSFDLPRVTAVRHVHDHVLWLAFDDGVSGTVDLSHRLVGPVLEPLRDAELFGRVRLGVSQFYGIVISMFYDDHARPHFRARLGSETIAIEIDGDGIRGSFPPNRLPLVFEWRERHREELRENWHRLRSGETALAIQPLD